VDQEAEKPQVSTRKMATMFLQAGKRLLRIGDVRKESVNLF
jgi:hypothetical protein